MRNMILNQDTDWNVIFDLFMIRFVLSMIFDGKRFLSLFECYEMKYANIIFSDFLWTMRSIYLPLMLVLKNGCTGG